MPAFLWPALIYGLVFVLHLAIPARRVDGYARSASEGRLLRYRLNGLRVFLIVVFTWSGACCLGLMPWNLLFVHRFELAAGACILGLVFSAAIVLAAPRRPGSSLLSDFYFGRLENPQWNDGRVDAKMCLYLMGAVMLELNVLSFAAHHILAFRRDWSPGVVLYAAMFTFFVVEYLTFEEVHLYTYDFLAEKVGFKLGWGCLVFYPFFYPIGLWVEAERPNPQTSIPLLGAVGALFFAGWVLARGANMQKFFFKQDPTKKAFGWLVPKVIEGEGRQLLASGFWGLSRHINYMGEILMATALTLSLGFPTDLVPWLYPLYYFALLFSRQHFDDRRCAAKYGALWSTYCERVPYRIIPFVY